MEQLFWCTCSGITRPGNSSGWLAKRFFLGRLGFDSSSGDAGSTSPAPVWPPADPAIPSGADVCNTRNVARVCRQCLRRGTKARMGLRLAYADEAPIRDDGHRSRQVEKLITGCSTLGRRVRTRQQRGGQHFYLHNTLVFMERPHMMCITTPILASNTRELMT
jgi:hypothetical protein